MIVPPMRLHLSCIVVFEPETKIANFIIFSLGNTVWGSVMRRFFSFSFFLRSACERGFRPVASRLSTSHCRTLDYSYLAQCYVEQDTDIFSPSSLLSSLLSLPLCL